MINQKEIDQAIWELQERLRVSPDIFLERWNFSYHEELRIKLDVIQNYRSPAWIYQKYLGSYNIETVESDNIKYNFAKIALEFMIGFKTFDQLFE